jgi:hypothetical protein
LSISRSTFSRLEKDSRVAEARVRLAPIGAELRFFLGEIGQARSLGSPQLVVV